MNDTLVYEEDSMNPALASFESLKEILEIAITVISGVNSSLNTEINGRLSPSLNSVITDLRETIAIVGVSCNYINNMIGSTNITENELNLYLEDSANKSGNFMESLLTDSSGNLLLSGFSAEDMELIKKGSKGEDVKKLQEVLISLGYLKASNEIDGIFGDRTLAALKKFQEDKGLASDGIAGKNTWDAVGTVLSSTHLSGVDNFIGLSENLTNLKKGSTGADVIALQTLLIELGYLKGKADGDFGNQTLAALKRLNANYRLDLNITGGVSVEAFKQIANDIENNILSIPPYTSSAIYDKEFFNGKGSHELEGVDGRLLARLEAMAKAYGLETLGLSDAFRTKKDQQTMYDNYKNGRGAAANEPGKSLHEYGGAVDLDRASWESREFFKNLTDADFAAFGLSRPAYKPEKGLDTSKDESWHIQIIETSDARVSGYDKGMEYFNSIPLNHYNDISEVPQPTY